jgi:hypothetical protein
VLLALLQRILLLPHFMSNCLNKLILILLLLEACWQVCSVNFFGDTSPKIDLHRDPTISIQGKKGFISASFAKSGFGMAGYSPEAALVDNDRATFVLCHIGSRRHEMIVIHSTIAIVSLLVERLAGSHDVLAGLVAVCANPRFFLCCHCRQIWGPAIAKHIRPSGISNFRFLCNVHHASCIQSAIGVGGQARFFHQSLPRCK